MNEELINVSEQKEVDANIDYIEAIREMKENTVSKEEFLKLKQEKKKLLDALIKGETIEVEKKETKRPTEEELRKRIRESKTMLDGVTAMLELRDLMIENGEGDTLLPTGSTAVITAEDREIAQHTLDGFKYCIERADGDPIAFKNELDRITVDVANPVLKARATNKRK